MRRHLANEAVPNLLNFLGAAGIRVECGHDLSVIAEVQALHPKAPRLFELANPLLQINLDRSNTFVLKLVRNEDNRPVGCVGCRLRWVEGSVGAALESQALLVDHPEFRRGQFIVTGDWARHNGDFHAAITTGLCIMPGNPGLMKVALRLLHLHVLGQWQFGFYLAVCGAEFAGKYPLDVEGYTDIRGGVMWERDGVWTPYRLVTATRAWWRDVIAPNERFSDLSWRLGEPQYPALGANQ